MPRIRLFSLLAVLGGCGTDIVVDPAHPDAQVVAGAPDAQPHAAPDASNPDAGPSNLDATAPLPDPDDPCARAFAGGPATDSLPLALSRAHSAIRYFGSDPTVETVDRALARAVGAPGAFGVDVFGYAERLADACALPTSNAALDVARTATDGDRFTVRPGTGAIAVPDEARVVIIDLRDLPDAPGLEAALAEVAALVVDRPISGLTERVRRYDGHPDEVYAPQLGITNVFSATVTVTSRPVIGARATLARPLVLLTSARLAPATARFVGQLRLANRGIIVGHDVLTRVAEFEWAPIGAEGVLFRARELQSWPDVIRADLPEGATLDQALAMPIATIARTPNTRPAFVPRTLQTPDFRGTPELGDLRAALITAHGTMHRFWPYFSLVGQDLDSRYTQLLTETETRVPATRREALRVLQRFTNALHDAHSYVQDYSPDASERPRGYFPAILDRVGDVAIVRNSTDPDIHAGDTIERINGASIADYYSRQSELCSFATQGNGDAQVSSMLQEMYGPLDLEVTPFGSRNSQLITIQPRPLRSLASLSRHATERRSGWLTDLGEPNTYFIQVEGELTSPEELLAAAQEARTAEKVIVDMRGYPWSFLRQYTDEEVSVQMAAYEFLFMGEPRSPMFETPLWIGLDNFELQLLQYTWPSNPQSFRARAALLVGPNTQSSAEDFSLYFLDGRPDTVVVGQNSSGTNGNITGVNLIGGFGMTFTGLGVRFPDGRRFHGVGIAPTVVVETTAEDAANHVDRTLLEAMRAL